MIHFDIASLENDLKQLESQTINENFWLDTKNSSIVLKKISVIKAKLEKYNKIKADFENLKDLSELLKIELDEEMAKDLIKATNKIEKEITNLEINTLLSGKYDINNAIITLHPGAGGTESQDWVQMLYRMYTRWAQDNGYAVKELDFLDGDEAGIKSVTALISGEYAYGYLKGEMGVHRLVRISPFDSGGRRHTSFASVEVLPEITDDIEIEIQMCDKYLRLAEDKNDMKAVRNIMQTKRSLERQKQRLKYNMATQFKEKIPKNPKSSNDNYNYFD